MIIVRGAPTSKRPYNDRKIHSRDALANPAEIVDLPGQQDRHFVETSFLGRHGGLPDIALQSLYVIFEVLFRPAQYVLQHHNSSFELAYFFAIKCIALIHAVIRIRQRSTA